MNNHNMTSATEEDIQFIMAEIKCDRDYVVAELKDKGVTINA